MPGRFAEILVGFFVVLAAGAFLAYALTLDGNNGSGKGYELVAKFGQASGVNVGTDVQIAGVKVGRVASVALDPVTYQARVAVRINNEHKIPIDSVIKIASNGLLGGAHLAIDPGADDQMLAAGEAFDYTQGSMDLMGILKAFAGGGAKETSSDAGTDL